MFIRNIKELRLGIINGHNVYCREWTTRVKNESKYHRNKNFQNKITHLVRLKSKH